MPRVAHKHSQDSSADIDYIIEIEDLFLGIIKLNENVFLLIDDNLARAGENSRVLLRKPGSWFIVDKGELDAFTRRHSMRVVGSTEKKLPFKIAGWIIDTFDLTEAAELINNCESLHFR